MNTKRFTSAFILDAGITLVVEDCTIKNGVNGIAFMSFGTATFAGVSTGVNAGILIQPASTGKVVAVIENVNVNNKTTASERSTIRR